MNFREFLHLSEVGSKGSTSITGGNQAGRAGQSQVTPEGPKKAEPSNMAPRGMGTGGPPVIPPGPGNPTKKFQVAPASSHLPSIKPLKGPPEGGPFGGSGSGKAPVPKENPKGGLFGGGSPGARKMKKKMKK